MTFARERHDVRMPGPAPIVSPLWPLRGLRMLSDPAEYFMTQYRDYGAVSAWQRRRPRHVFVFDPDVMKEVFSQPDVYIADAFRAVRMPVDSSFHLLTNGLLRLNGVKHRTHRRLIQPTFTPRKVQVHFDTVLDAAKRRIDRWRGGDVLRMDEQIGAIVLTTAMRSVFGFDADEQSARLQVLISRLMGVAVSPLNMLLPYDLPATPFRTALRTCEQIEAILRDLIRDRRRDAADRADVLSHMISATDGDGAALSDDELVSEAYTALCHDSSAATLLWALLLLDRHPQVFDQLVTEVNDVLGGADPDADALQRMPLLDGVLLETLRLLPPAPMLLRYTAQETKLAGYDLPEGATVFFSPYVTHRIPELYEDPMHFRPERWSTGSHPSAFAYMPFGAGVHSCVGRHFALLEMKIILAVLLQRFRPALIPQGQVDREMRVSLVPSNGLPMVLHPAGASVRRAPLRGNILTSVTMS